MAKQNAVGVPATIDVGGTGAITLTDGGVLLGSGTAAITATAQMTNGQILVGSGSADPAPETLTSSDSSITFTTGAGTLSIQGAAATDTQAGVIEVATNAETNTGTAVDRCVSPAGLTAWTGDTALITTGALSTGSIATGFGAIDNGTSNITTGGILTIDVDGAAASAGALVMGAGSDASIFFDGTNLNILTDGAGASGIILDSEDDTVEIKGSGALQATFSSAGLDLESGDNYRIATTVVLSSNTLGSGVTTSSLTTVGAISSGTWSATDIAVTAGGSGRSNAVAYTPLCGGTVTTGNHQSVASIGSSGDVLTSQGAGALPQFAAPVVATDVIDSTFRIQDDGDITKELAFQCSTIGTGTVKTITMPNADVDLTINADYSATAGNTSLVTTGALSTGSIATGFGVIDNGTSNITTGGQLTLDVDGAAASAGALVMGVGSDASIFFDGTNLQILSDGAGASGIIIDSEDDTVEIKGSGALQATFNTSGLDLVTGDAYYINSASVLNATTLGGAVVASSLTSVGTITSGVWSGTAIVAAKGGTGLTSITDNAVMVGSGTGSVTPLAVGSNGQVLLGSTAADPVFGTVSSSDSSIEFTTGAGTLTIQSATATTSQMGATELSTDAESVTGTSDVVVVTPGTLTARLAAPGAIGGTTPAAGAFTTLSTTGLATIGTHLKMTAMPAFRAYNSSTDSNVTGDGTDAVLDCDTEEFDYGSDFATDTFTAPVAGLYDLRSSIKVNGCTASHTSGFQTIVVGTTDTVRVKNNMANMASAGTDYEILISAQLLLAASDTVTIELVVSNGTKVVDIGQGSTFTWFSGALITEA